MQKYRVTSFVAVHILIFIHVLWFQNSSLGSFDFQEFFDRFLGEGVLNAGAIMVILAFILTLVFGRFFCGWMCHFGAVQEFAWWVFSKFGIKPKTINSRLIAFLPLIISSTDNSNFLTNYTDDITLQGGTVNSSLYEIDYNGIATFNIGPKFWNENGFHFAKTSRKVYMNEKPKYGQILPPNYESLPSPNERTEAQSERISIKGLVINEGSTSEEGSSSESSIEKNILKKIKKN